MTTEPKKPKILFKRAARRRDVRTALSALTIDDRGVVRRLRTSERLARTREAAQARAALWGEGHSERLRAARTRLDALPVKPSTREGWRERLEAQAALAAVEAERSPAVPPALGARPWDAPVLALQVPQPGPAGTRARHKRTYPYGLPDDFADSSRRAADREMAQRDRRAAARELGCAMRDLRPLRPEERPPAGRRFAVGSDLRTWVRA